jgi:SH3-like domain-containing protein
MGIETKWGRLKAVLSVAAVLSAAFSPTAQSAQFDSARELMSVAVKHANVRAEPNEEAEVLWKMWKFMPLEIVAYRGDWRRIRDLDGDEGWMHKSSLGNVPTVMVKKDGAKLRKSRGGAVLWIMDRGYALRVFSVRGAWIEVSDLSSASGWIRTSDVWGFTTSSSLKQPR